MLLLNFRLHWINFLHLASLIDQGHVSRSHREFMQVTPAPWAFAQALSAQVMFFAVFVEIFADLSSDQLSESGLKGRGSGRLGASDIPCMS